MVYAAIANFKCENKTKSFNDDLTLPSKIFIISNKYRAHYSPEVILSFDCITMGFKLSGSNDMYIISMFS